MNLPNKNRPFLLALLAIVGITSQYFCSQPAPTPGSDATPAKTQISEEEIINKGKYYVTMAGCNDCHTPKIMTPAGPELDTTRILSGHPAGSPMIPITYDATKPGNWMLAAPDLTSWVGPWGISFTANLTPDPVTGLGSWTPEVFIKTLRTGKHLGQPGGRQILPPMPWQMYAQLTDEDLTMIFTYLQTIPAIKNQVPVPVPPNEVMKKK